MVAITYNGLQLMAYLFGWH